MTDKEKHTQIKEPIRNRERERERQILILKKLEFSIFQMTETFSFNFTNCWQMFEFCVL